jgi:hypothetical protein
VTAVNAAGSSLSAVTVNTQPNFVYNLTQILNEQVLADQQLYNALAVVNSTKTILAVKQTAYTQLQANLAAA